MSLTSLLTQTWTPQRPQWAKFILNYSGKVFQSDIFLLLNFYFCLFKNLYIFKGTIRLSQRQVYRSRVFSLSVSCWYRLCLGNKVSSKTMLTFPSQHSGFRILYDCVRHDFHSKCWVGVEREAVSGKGQLWREQGPVVRTVPSLPHTIEAQQP